MEVNAGVFSEEYLNVGDFRRQFHMPLLYHKCRRLSVNTEELECMARDVMRNFFYIDLSYCKKDFYNLS